MTLPNSATDAVPRKRRPRLTRVAKDSRPGHALTERDVAICEALCDYRCLDTSQIVQLLFKPSTRSQCLLRLKLLFHHEYVQRTEQAQVLSEGRLPLVNWLAERGAEVVAKNRGIPLEELDWDPKEALRIRDLFRTHLLKTNQIRIQIALSAQRHGFTLEEWRDEKRLKRDHREEKVKITLPNGTTQLVRVEPDGYGVLVDATAYPSHVYRFFLETDLATETLASENISYRTLARKVQVYLAYFQSEMYKRRYRTEAGKGRVLIVTTSERRLENLKREIERLSGRARFWLTTFERIQSGDVLTDSAVWTVAAQAGTRALVR